jgi:hypothetical protein
MFVTTLFVGCLGNQYSALFRVHGGIQCAILTPYLDKLSDMELGPKTK